MSRFERQSEKLFYGSSPWDKYESESPSSVACEKYRALRWCVEEYLWEWAHDRFVYGLDEEFRYGHVHPRKNKGLPFANDGGREYMVRLALDYKMGEEAVARVRREYEAYLQDHDVGPADINWYFAEKANFEPGDKGWRSTIEFVEQALSYARQTGPRYLYRYDRWLPSVPWNTGPPEDGWWTRFERLDPHFGAIVPFSYIVAPIEDGYDPEDVGAAQFERLRADIDWTNCELDGWVSAVVEQVNIVVSGPWPFGEDAKPILEPGIRCDGAIYDRTSRQSLVRDRLLVNCDMSAADAVAYLARLKDHVVILLRSKGKARLGYGLETVERGYQVPMQGRIAEWAARFRQTKMSMSPEEAATEIDRRLAPKDDTVSDFEYYELYKLRRLASIYSCGKYDQTRLEILRRWHEKDPLGFKCDFEMIDVSVMSFFHSTGEETGLGEFDMKTLLASRRWGGHAFETPCQAAAWLVETVSMAAGLAQNGPEWQPGGDADLSPLS